MGYASGRAVTWLSAMAAASLVATAAVGHDGAVDDALHDNKQLLHDPGVADGHVESNVNYGFDLIGWDPLGGIATGRYTDVWAHEGYAYVGTFQEPTCDRAGVYISDIRDPTNPVTVDMISSPPNTRINDVKVHAFGQRDVLIFTLEPCGIIRPGNAGQKGQGGVSLYDVTDPTRPHAIKQNFLDTPVHNTFSWTTGNGRSYTLAVDDVNVNDVIIFDSTRPQAPRRIAVTGIGDWLSDPNNPIADDGQLFTGAFAAPLLHDVWVENLGTAQNEQWVAVLSYWDAGFVLLDVTDPANPVFIDDSTYPGTDPVLDISPMEGNAHAAVFGEATLASAGTITTVFGGDEDFDQFYTAVSAASGDYAATQGSDTPPVVPGSPVQGTAVYVGLACAAIPAAPAADGYIAVVQRGDCAFTTKAGNAEAAGYDAVVVFNSDAPGNCEASVSMLVTAGIPAVFVPRSSGFAILGVAYDGSTCGDGSTGAQVPSVGLVAGVISVNVLFDGWGYFHAINASGSTVTTKVGMDGYTMDVPSMGHIGFYAPAEVADPAKAVGYGDLTMHNLETDPTARDRSFISWYSLGMRAVEFREGHLHIPSPENAQTVWSWNLHEVGRWIASPELYGAEARTTYGDEALSGSNFWGVHVTEVDVGGTPTQVILGSDRNTGLHIFTWSCVGVQDPQGTLYCTN